MFVPYIVECEYQLDFRTKDKDNPLGVATIYHPTQVNNHYKLRKIERAGYKFYKIDKLTIITHNSIKKFDYFFSENHVPQPMLMTKKYN